MTLAVVAHIGAGGRIVRAEALRARRRHCRRCSPWRSLARVRNSREHSRNPGHTHNRRNSRGSKAALRRWRRCSEVPLRLLLCWTLQ
jgi:hypothetical protein